MTSDPYRTRASVPQNDPYVNPYRLMDNRAETGSAGFLFLGALSLFAVAGFIYFFGTNDRELKMSADMLPLIIQPDNPALATPPETTGAGGTE